MKVVADEDQAAWRRIRGTATVNEEFDFELSGEQLRLELIGGGLLDAALGRVYVGKRLPLLPKNRTSLPAPFEHPVERPGDACNDQNSDRAPEPTSLVPLRRRSVIEVRCAIMWQRSPSSDEGDDFEFVTILQGVGVAFGAEEAFV